MEKKGYEELFDGIYRLFDRPGRNIQVSLGYARLGAVVSLQTRIDHEMWPQRLQSEVKIKPRVLYDYENSAETKCMGMYLFPKLRLIRRRY